MCYIKWFTYILYYTFRNSCLICAKRVSNLSAGMWSRLRLQSTAPIRAGNFFLVDCDSAFNIVAPFRGGGIKGILPWMTRTAKSGRDAGLQVQALDALDAHRALVFITSVTNDSMTLRLDHKRGHRVRSELSTHCLPEGLPWHTPFCTDEEHHPQGNCSSNTSPRLSS